MPDQSPSPSRSFFPSVPSWVSAVLLHVFYRAYAVAMAVALMALIELARSSPRLAVLGGLAAWISPVVVIALGHHIGHAVLDRGSTQKIARGVLPGAASVWAGFVGWLVMWFATSMTVFAVLLVHPPEPQPDAYVRTLASLSGGWELASLQTAVWIIAAALLFQAERRATRQAV
jgi:hypothetical protein